MFQHIHISISAVLFTFSAAYLFRSIFIYKKFDKHLFIALSSLGASMYAFFQYKLNQDLSNVDIIFFHRWKIIAAMVTLPCWFFVMYEIYSIKKSLAWFYLIFTTLIATLVPFEFFLGEPVRKCIKIFLE